MKLFGKKDKNAAAPEALPADDLGEMDAGLDEVEGASVAAQPLSAPSRNLSGAAGGGRKNLLILVLLVAVLAVGGGYFWLMGESDSEPIHVTAKTNTPPMPQADIAAAPAPAVDPMAPPADPMAAPADPMAAPADPMAAATPAVPAAAGATPADPFATPADPAASVAAVDPMAPPAADPMAAPADPMAVPADPMAAPADPMAAATPAAPVTDPAAAAAVLGLPPADDATAIAAVPAPAAGAPEDAIDMPAAETMPATPDGMPPQPAAAAADPAAAPVEAAPGETAPSWAAPGTAAVPGTTNPAANATSPNEAELAIVQHADVIDQLSRPADGQASAAAGTPLATGAPFDPSAPVTSNRNAMKTVGEILEQPGVVRPLPSGYMTIRKESDAGSIDSRLTKARTALAQENNSAALELFTELQADYPKDKRILMGRAVSLHKMGQKDEALAAYEAVLNRDPKNLDALNNMLGLLKEKDPQLAVEKLQELHDAYPYQGDIAAQLGVAYGSTGQYDQALRYLNLADSLKPGSAFVMYNKSVLLDKMGRSREAASMYRQILRLAADGEIDQNLPLESIRRRLAALQ